MIIIKTSNGDSFINEKETQIVQHDKANKQVIIRSSKEGLNCIINNVEVIIYTNDAQPTSWKNEELQSYIRISKRRKEMTEKWQKSYDNIRGDFFSFVFDIINFVEYHKDELGDYVRKRIIERAEELKTKIHNDEYLDI